MVIKRKIKNPKFNSWSVDLNKVDDREFVEVEEEESYLKHLEDIMTNKPLTVEKPLPPEQKIRDYGAGTLFITNKQHFKNPKKHIKMKFTIYHPDGSNYFIRSTRFFTMMRDKDFVKLEERFPEITKEIQETIYQALKDFHERRKKE
jgi:hypothetical protein